MMKSDIAVLGTGTIGMSWVALFAGTGRRVSIYDPSPETEFRVLEMIESTSDTLCALGYKFAGDTSQLTFTSSPEEAVNGAMFIQENVPERLAIKHALYARIEPVLHPQVIVATSTSGLKLSELQLGFKDPGRLVIGHPFNPPHLIPLVELMENDQTKAGVPG